MTKVIEEKDKFIFPCPNCENFIIVLKKELNCKIFRHGYFYVKKGKEIKLTNQLPPHSKKDYIDKLLKDNKILGCGKPFRINIINKEYFVEKCDYI
jgi:hypothetical protein